MRKLSYVMLFLCMLFGLAVSQAIAAGPDAFTDVPGEFDTIVEPPTAPPAVPINPVVPPFSPIDSGVISGVVSGLGDIADVPQAGLALDAGFSKRDANFR